MQPDVISEEEEGTLVAEAERYLRTRRYEPGHFDGVIAHYRELQRPIRQWSAASRAVLNRVAGLALPAGVEPMPIHVLDLKPEGWIGRHVDHVEYSGGYIAGVSLLSHAVMLLEREGSEDGAVELLLPRRSLYVLYGDARYKWGHSIPLEPVFQGEALPPKGRRISVLLRDPAPQGMSFGADVGDRLSMSSSSSHPKDKANNNP
eukprot:scaffold250826_cov28-Tisochrysis_lutea.AAC.1